MVHSIPLQEPMPTRPEDRPAQNEQPGRKRPDQSKNWCITWNNYPTDVDRIIEKFFDEYCEFFIYEAEHTNGAIGTTPHIQGYFQLKQRKMLSWIRNNLSSQAHYEIARGDVDKNIEYCSKEGRAKKLGAPIKQGQRLDLSKLIEENRNIYSLMDAEPETYCRYKAGLEAIMARKEFNAYSEWRANNQMKIIWLWGPTGTGKTWTAMHADTEIDMSSKICLIGNLNEYLRGYTDQRVVVFDDLREDSIRFNYLLALLQPYPTYVKTFGAIRPWMPEIIYITAPMAPTEMFGKKWDLHTKSMIDNGDIAQLTCRLTEVRYVGGINHRIERE